MTFSVIIPCYNCVTTLKTTVDSIRESGLSDYEILLVDDGSADSTAELCDRLCREYPNIRCIHQPNAGVSSARNRGIDAARGDYIWFVDADDTVDRGAMSHAAGILIRQQPDALLFGMSFDYYHHGRLYRRDKLVPPFDGIMMPEQMKSCFSAFYESNALTPVWNKLYRREMLIQSGVRFHENMILMEDFLFVLELLPYCRTIYSLPEAIYRYRQAEDEKGAYRRLQRIPELAEYMQPFEDGIGALGISNEVVINLYQMLLGQKLYYAPLAKIREEIMQHQQSRYAFLPMERPIVIYLRSRKTQLRHRLAIAVKSSRVYQRRKAGAAQ